MGSNAKAEARAAARARRRRLVASRDLEQDAARLADHVVALVADHLASTPHPPPVCRVAAYTAYGTEPPTHLLLSALAAAGHEVVLPRMLADRSLEWVGPGGADLGTGALSTALVVVTPGLAVDRQRTRLGQGGGSYDRALAHRGPDTLVVTLLHDGELLGPADAPLPREEHDVLVDGVVSPDAGVVDLRQSLSP